MPLLSEIILVPFACAIILALALSIYSFFVVVKRWAFLSVGVSHAAFGGIALGYLLHVSPQISALIFAVFAAVIITLIKEKGNVPEDTTIGVIFSTFMAVGVILFSLSTNYVSDVLSYLFGNVLMVTKRDLLIACVLLLVTILFFIKFKRALFLMIVDEEMAYTCGVNVTLTYYLLVTLFTVSVVMAIKLLGVILVSSLTVVPATVALFFFTRLHKILIASALLSVSIVIAGMTLSIATDLPPGATTALIAGGVFLLGMCLKNQR